MRILLVLPSFAPGGCERQVAILAEGLVRAGHEVGVAVFTPGGEFEADVLAAGVQVLDLAKGGLAAYPFFFARFVKRIRAWRPDVIHGFLGTPNALLALAKPFFAGIPLLWGIRASDIDLSSYRLRTRIVTTVESLLSAVPDRIVSNSEAGKRDAVDRGFPEAKMVVIPNGIDVDRFRPDAAAGLAVRAEWGVGGGERIIGMAARMDPMKGHETFLDAAARLSPGHPGYRFVLVGGGNGGHEDGLRRHADSLGLGDRLIWAGHRRDMRAVHNAFDVCCLSSSYGEGFPNVVGETMACGTPCVVTDCGDAALIAGGCGEHCPPEDPKAFAEAVERMMIRVEADPEGVSERCRRRIGDNYGVKAMVGRTEALLRSMISSNPASPGA